MADVMELGCESGSSDSEDDIPVGTTFIVNDGVLGVYQSKWCRSITVEGGSMKELIFAVRSTVENSVSGLKRIIILSGGNVDITHKVHEENRDNSYYPDMATIVMDNVTSFHNEVKEAGGRLIVTSLIPRPSEVDPCITSHGLGVERAVALQKFLSSVYVRLNEEFFNFNKANDNKHINLKFFLERKSKKDSKGNLNKEYTFYHRREQRIILIEHFKSDFVHVHEEMREKMLKFIRKYLSPTDWKVIGSSSRGKNRGSC